MGILAVEGSSFSGKTTMVNLLGEHFSGRIIGEYYDYAIKTSKDGFPPFAKTRDQLDQQIDYFLNLEAERTAEVEESSQVKPIIVDRTAASLVAFQRSMQELPEYRENSWDADAMQRRIKTATYLGRVIMPDIVIVLSAGSRQEHERRVGSRGVIESIPTLNQWDFSESIRLNTLDALNAIYPYTDILEANSLVSKHELISLVGSNLRLDS
jgi:thymidylate kinase